MRRTAVVLWLALAGVTALHVNTSPAQTNSGAIAFLLDPSIRGAGMGRAGATVYWGGDVLDWRNPALLGYARGISVSHARTQLVPTLADDVFWDTRRATIGARGIGVVLQGKGAPFDGVGSGRLDYGTTYAIDENGQVLGSFSSYEKMTAFGVGVNLVEAAEAACEMISVDMPRVSRFVDVSLGIASKSDSVNLAPAWATGTGRDAIAEVHTRDRGLLVRATPLNTMDRPAILSSVADDVLNAALGGLAVDASYAIADLNYTNARIAFFDLESSDPIARGTRHAAGVYARSGYPRWMDAAFYPSVRRWVRSICTPVVAFGSTWERTHWAADASRETIAEHGWELTLFNVFSLRRGRVDDPVGTIQDTTSGYGVGFSLAGALGVRYDHASIPLSRFLEPDNRMTRNGVTMFVDPFRLQRFLSGADDLTAIATQ